MKNMPFEKVLIRALNNILGGPALNSQQGSGGVLHGLTHDFQISIQLLAFCRN